MHNCYTLLGEVTFQGVAAPRSALIVLLTCIDLALQELKGNIRVFCRVRPVSAAEQASPDHDSDLCLDFPTSGRSAATSFPHPFHLGCLWGRFFSQSNHAQPPQGLDVAEADMEATLLKGSYAEMLQHQGCDQHL